MPATKVTSAEMNPSKTTDANGWTVYDYGTWKEYVRNVAISSGSVGAQGIASTATFSPPVGITDLSSYGVLVSLRATGFDANRWTFALQQRSMPTSLFIEAFNCWTGGSLTLTGTFTVRVTS